MTDRYQRTPLQKTPTGIPGLDEICSGGFPKGRPTLVCGGAGSGKTLLGIEFLVNGASLFNDPGVFISFEETPQDLICNVDSLGYDLIGLMEAGRLSLDYVHIDHNELEVAGEFSLDGLFIRIEHSIDMIGAQRVVLDSIETVFSGISNPHLLRAELQRLFSWLKNKGVTAVITAERGETTLTRHGLEEYISDCVIALDHRVNDQVSTRRLHILKYRGSIHGTNEYPFLIDSDGISVLPITSLGLEHPASDEFVSSGVEALDVMLGGKGFYRGSSVLVTGTAGSGKTSLAAHFINAACARGERVLYFLFEESVQQVVRNMNSIGQDLGKWIDMGLLQIQANRPTLYGLEMHLAIIHKTVSTFDPSVTVFDPINAFLESSDQRQVSAMLMRLVDFIKSRQITALFTSLTTKYGTLENTDMAISPLIDTWLSLRDMEVNGERNRVMHVLKSRGMAHSNQIREFLLTSEGIHVQDAYLGAGGVLTGSARLAQEAHEKASQVAREQAIERKRRDLQRKRLALEAQIVALRTQFELDEEDIIQDIAQAELREERLVLDEKEMATKRHTDD